MAARDRTYLALAPIDGPTLELGVTLQPFVLGEDVVTRGTLKGPSAFRGTPGTMYLDAATASLFSVTEDLDGPTNLGPYGRLDREIYGSDLLRQSAGQGALHLTFDDCDAPEALVRCLYGASPDCAAIARAARTLYQEPLDPVRLREVAQGGEPALATMIRRHDYLPVDPAGLHDIALRAVREVARMNTALLAPATPGCADTPYRPALTVPVEETWTLRRLFGRPRIGFATRPVAA